MKIQLESQADLQFLTSLYLQHLQPHVPQALIDEYLLNPLHQNIQLQTADSTLGEGSASSNPLPSSLSKVSELICALANATPSLAAESAPQQHQLVSPTLTVIPELQPGWKQREWRERPLPGSGRDLEDLNALLRIQGVSE